MTAGLRLVLVRHTALLGGEGLCYGRHALPLAASFAAEAEAVRARLPGRPWRGLFSSPAARCRRLAEALGAKVTEDARLQELDFGAWEGRPWAALPAEALASWQDGFPDAAAPGGESYAALAARAEAFVADLARAGPGTVVAVTHGGVMRALLAPRRGLTWIEAFALALPPGAVEVLDIAARPAEERRLP